MKCEEVGAPPILFMLAGAETVDPTNAIGRKGPFACMAQKTSREYSPTKHRSFTLEPKIAWSFFWLGFMVFWGTILYRLTFLSAPPARLITR